MYMARKRSVERAEGIIGGFVATAKKKYHHTIWVAESVRKKIDYR